MPSQFDTITWRLGIETLRRKYRSESFSIGLGNRFLDMTLKAQIKTTK